MDTYEYLQTAKISRVFNSTTGKEIDAAELVKNNEQGILLRTKIEQSILRGEPLYLCPECFKPLKLRSTPQKIGQIFYHVDVANNCPKLEEKGISQKHIRAIKYNGAKESIAHKEIKQFIIDSLNADPNFSNIAPEKTWRGEVDETKFRRPDVRATYNGPNGQINIAFEVQLSTTFLSEIVGRSEFYRKENGLVIWILKEFDIKNARLTDLDIFYPNNLNAFVVNEETVTDSKQRQKFMLECHWAEPVIQGDKIDNLMNSKTIVFDSLKLVQQDQQAFFFDYQHHAIFLQCDLDKAKLEKLKSEFLQYCITTEFDYRDNRFNEFYNQFCDLSVPPPEFTKKLHRLIVAIYSLKIGQVVLYGFNNLLQFGNLLYDKAKEHFILFLIATLTYNQKSSLEKHKNTARWKEKKTEAWQNILTQKDSPYTWNEDVAQFISLLFPEYQEQYIAVHTKLLAKKKS